MIGLSFHVDGLALCKCGADVQVSSMGHNGDDEEEIKIACYECHNHHVEAYDIDRKTAIEKAVDLWNKRMEGV
jgi:hypothetical protein